ncbi:MULTISPECIES: hypothetical protein [unclassified Carboxylicivirga]|uniref:hypothetical protein n=1 Tax=Carboxylicivirga TaxID=1628153 RepID=UPI003D33B0B4
MRFIYISLFALLFASCEEITVGYLDAENATYGIDSLVIDKAAIIKIDDDLTVTSEIYYADLVSEFYRLIYTVDVYDDFDQLENGYLELLTKTDHLLTPAELQNVNGIYLDVLYVKSEADKGNPDLYKYKIKSSFSSIRYYLSTYIETRLKRHINNVPWVTNAIQGIEGTFPLRFEIDNIRSVDYEANASEMLDLFADPDAEKYTGIRGNGSIQVPYRTTLPNDTYVLDVKISNEGRQYVQKEVLRIIIK